MSDRTITPAARVLLALSAVAVVVAGIEHARLWHRGYEHVDVVGPLFLLNAIASLVVVLLLVFGFPRLFVLGALAIELGSLVSIYISHTTSFFGFAESSYEGPASVIVVAEIIAVVLALAGWAALGSGRRVRVREALA